MRLEEFQEQLDVIRRELPDVFSTFSEPDFIESWYRDHFAKYRPECSAEALGQVRKRDILNKSGRFMNEWSLVAARLNGEATAAEANARLLEHSAVCEDESARAFYRCRTCRDTGYVSIWSQRTMADLLHQKPIDAVRWSEMTAACSCERGEAKCRQKKGKELGRFGEQDYFLESRVPDARAKAIEFVDLFREGMHRKERAFDAWNNAKEF